MAMTEKTDYALTTPDVGKLPKLAIHDEIRWKGGQRVETPPLKPIWIRKGKRPAYYGKPYEEEA